MTKGAEGAHAHREKGELRTFHRKSVSVSCRAQDGHPKTGHLPRLARHLSKGAEVCAMGNREKAIAERLATWEAEFHAGERIRSLEAMSLCLQFDQPIPAWAVPHFCTSVTKYTNADARTLDEAFDVSRAKSWRRPKEKSRRGRGLAANLMADGRIQFGGTPVKGAVAEVAEKLSMDASTAERYYYDKEINSTLKRPQKTRKSEDD